ncbi:MAG: DUF29 domain-containing protein [Pleurocapsa sp. CRU_1_2]|nr:DUF29 domain-containing protein [Pleurocapsa sp. CRU_1_2]
MEEILELKDCLLNHQYERAIAIVEELEQMGRQDKINNLESFLVILLIHLIKIQVEKRVTRSWRSSILNSLREIQKRNKLGKKSQYIKQNEWLEHIVDVYPDAIFKTADEAFGGIEIPELKSLVDISALQNITLELLDFTYTLDGDSMVKMVCDRFPVGRLL